MNDLPTNKKEAMALKQYEDEGGEASNQQPTLTYNNLFMVMPFIK